LWVNSNGEELPIKLKPGDLLIYRGSEIEHWRDRFIGLNHSQVFLHYNDKNSTNTINDDRPYMGVPNRRDL
jgi:hypothetical protein